MSTLKALEFSGFLIPRTCSRCGTTFGAVGREYTCFKCRKPKRKKRVYTRELSFREKQIVGLLQKAHANKEIAAQLHLTEGTVKEYLYNIFRKVGVKNRTELALWAMENLRSTAPSVHKSLPVAVDHKIWKAEKGGPTLRLH